MRNFASFAALLLVLTSASLFAQFNTPVIDGTITTGEYGSNNQIGTNTAQTWYMTWDDTNLYVAVTNANLSEGAVLYIDSAPVSPANGGTNANGNLSGFNYDNEQITNLPFRAQFVTYFKDGYREYRRSDGNGNWTGSTAYAGSYASGAGNVRELSIPWAAITGAGRPVSFLFLGLLTSSGGYVYGQIPNDNPGAVIGTSAAYTQYYTVNNTNNGTSTPPFSIESSAPLQSSIDLGSLKHDTFDAYYRAPFGAVQEGTPVALRFRTAHFGVDGVSLRVYQYDPATDSTAGPTDYPLSFLENRTENGTMYDVWSYTLTTPASPAVLYYKFKIVKGSSTAFYSDSYQDDNDNLNQGGDGVPSLSEPFPSFQLTVYDPNFQTPAWLANANVYHIFPDRFRNGDITNDYCRSGSTVTCPVFYGNQNVVPHTVWNEQIFDPNQPGPYFNTFGTQFYGGDLKGIQDKLDYLQSLGFDTIYMNPIFSARSNHRYDTDNYLEVDPALGGDAALQALSAETDHRGMRLILDGVFNHSSSDSLYFDRYHRYATDGACESLTSPYRSWYQFLDNTVPCGTPDYTSWAGFDSLPVFAHTNPAVRDFFYRGADNVVQHWYNRGAGGWRFDVANELGHDWWHDFRGYAKGYKADGPLIGEIWPDASQWLAGDQLDSVMNYRFRKNVLGFVRGGASWSDTNNNGINAITALAPSQFDHALRSVREDYPPQSTATMLNLIDSHDTNRALYVLTESGDSGLSQAKDRLKLAALFQFAYLGAPMVFYGDEAGMNSPSLFSGSDGAHGDPYTRAPYPWSDESGDPTVYGPADGSLITYYSALAHLRKQHDSLRSGDFVTLLMGDTAEPGTAANTFAFARVAPSETAIVALNNGAATNNATVPVSGYFSDGTSLQDPLSGNTYTVSGGAVSVSLSPRSGVILLPAPATLDLTPPVATITPTPSANTNGWNNTPVTLNFSASDTGSGVSQIRYWAGSSPSLAVAGSSAIETLSSEGQYSIGMRAIDNAGNTSPQANATVQIDLTAPTVTCSGVPMFFKGQAGATVSATVADSLSGPMAPSVSSAVSTANVGPQTVSLTGSDLAGNTTTASCGFNVDYRFSGFFPPISGGLNSVQSGSAVPVQFSLSGYQGQNIFAGGSPNVQPVSCSTRAPQGSAQPATSVGSLTYSAATDQYTWVWKTSKSTAGQCMLLNVTLSDGTNHTAAFSLR